MKKIIQTMLLSFGISQACFSGEIFNDQVSIQSPEKSLFEEAMLLYKEVESANNHLNQCTAVCHKYQQEYDNLADKTKREVLDCLALHHKQAQENVLRALEELAPSEKEYALKFKKEFKGKDIHFNGAVLISKDISLKNNHYKLIASIFMKYPHKLQELKQKLSKSQEDEDDAHTNFLSSNRKLTITLKNFSNSDLQYKLKKKEQEEFKSMLSSFNHLIDARIDFKINNRGL